jgi:prepilin-type N-terminal cleavage/methylation domain-containing protein
MIGERGMSMAELLVAMAITALIVAAAGLYLRPMEAPLVSGIALLEGCVQRARAEAVASTSAYRLTPRGPGRIEAEVGDSCATTTWADDPKVSVELPQDVRMTDTTWSLCIDSRGLPGTNLTITLNHPDYGSRAVEVLLGGATRTLP